LRSHPPALLTLVARTLRDECAVSRGDRVMVAVSGGADSSALLHALARLAPRLGLELRAHGVDHGLRVEAAGELDRAEELAARLRVPFARTRLRVALGGNLQARARTARYAALRRVAAAEGARWIATAHHADDRAETVLLRLMRGAPPSGLAVLPARSADVLRPLIRAGRADVLAHLERHGIGWAEDPSNRDRRFLRCRVREELIPLFESMSPGIVRHLCSLADELGQGPAPDVLDEKGEPVRLNAPQRRALRHALASGAKRARIRLSGGREIRVDSKTRLPALAYSKDETRSR
jgi:tRNA(Ile)-lysidine synthase